MANKLFKVVALDLVYVEAYEEYPIEKDKELYAVHEENDTAYGVELYVHLEAVVRNWEADEDSYWFLNEDEYLDNFKVIEDLGYVADIRI